MTMKRYVKRKPDVVRAIQFTGENEYEILREFCGSWGGYSLRVNREIQGDGKSENRLKINSERAGIYILSERDYLTKTTDKKFAVYSEDEFLRIYKEIE